MRKTVPLKQVIETVIYLQIFDETEPCLLFINIAKETVLLSRLFRYQYLLNPYLTKLGCTATEGFF